MIIIQVRTYEVNPQEDEDPIELIQDSEARLVDVTYYTHDEYSKLIDSNRLMDCDRPHIQDNEKEGAINEGV